MALKEYRPCEFDKLCRYETFAITRDPFERFASSVSQRLLMYSSRPLRNRSLQEVSEAIDECIDYLEQHGSSPHPLPPEYIHFQRQIDYIELDDTRVANRLYTVDRVAALLEDVSKLIGRDVVIAGGPPNRSLVFRNRLVGSMIESSRPITNLVGAVLPIGVKRIARNLVYVPRDHRFRGVFAGKHVQQFVREYYAEDIALFQEVRSGETKRQAPGLSEATGKGQRPTRVAEGTRDP
jgi:hypothetical protein